MSYSPRSSLDINKMEDFDFSTLTNHEIEILKDFGNSEGNNDLVLTNLITSIIKVFQKTWRERDINAKASEAIGFMDFSEYEGSKANNPIFSFLMLRLSLKFAKEQGDEDMKKNILDKMKVEWEKFLGWFNWHNDDEEGEQKEEEEGVETEEEEEKDTEDEEPVLFAVSATQFAQYKAFQEGYAGMPSWFMDDDTKANEIMSRYNELAEYYGY